MIDALARLDASSVVQDPFPHLVANDFLQAEVADELRRTFPAIRRLARWRPVAENQKLYRRADAALGDPATAGAWRALLAETMLVDVAFHLVRIFGPSIAKEHPELALGDRPTITLRRSGPTPPFEGLLLDSNQLLHTPTRARGSERGVHLKTLTSLLLGYVNLGNADPGAGADFALHEAMDMNPIPLHGVQEAPRDRVRLVRTIPRRHNQFLVFLNTPRSFQEITPREPSAAPLMFHHLVLHAPRPLYQPVFAPGASPIPFEFTPSARRTIRVLGRKLVEWARPR
jgi:hypothetical protein